MDEQQTRPDPDALLHLLKSEEEKQHIGALKVFFGMCAGVGKTYDMLKAAHEARRKGIDVVVGYVETHHRPETDVLLTGLTILPRRVIEYKGTVLEEMDLDAILARKPALVLVDELAHTNAPGSRHTKRYQDVLELLDNGIDVFTTLNVQHLESRADTVAQITGAVVRETVPDSILERASDVELIDLSPDELLQRLADGKVYAPERSKRAIENYFRKGNLTALREMSLRITAERVDRQLRDYMRSNRIAGPWKSGQRLLVGITGSPDSIRLIRWARRVAFTQAASWIAVHVETSTPTSDEERRQLGTNIKLAQELGAEILTTADEDISDALVRIARQENCTQILVGKPRGGLFRRRQRILEALIEKSGDLDVYVVGGGDEADRPRALRLPAIHSGLPQYIVGASVIMAVTLLCFPIAHIVGYQTVALILLLTVAILPLMLGVGPVLLAAGLSALAWDFFFIPPLYTFTIGKTQDVLLLLMYFCIAIVSGVLTSRARAQEKAVRIREERAVALYTLSRDLSMARSKDTVAKVAVENIRRFLNADVALFLGQTDGDIFAAAHPSSTMPVDEKEFSVAAWVYWNEKPAGRFTDTLPSAEATYFPISGPRYPLGVLGVKTGANAPLTIDQEVLLENCIRQIASAVEREVLNEVTSRTLVIEESEKLYKTLFNSVSHEMRTPLSAIIGASESLTDGRIAERTDVRHELVRQIHDAAGRLDRLVGNLLDMTRLESGLIRPKLDWCDVGDLARAASGQVAAELARHRWRLDVPADLPLVRMDFGLMEQVLTNLLVNAALYNPPGTEIVLAARIHEGHCELTVTDNGTGLPAGAEDRIFDKFYRVPGSTTGGTGLGLSIARGFVEAHRGTITAARRPEGGTRFVVRIPADEMRSDRGEE